MEKISPAGDIYQAGTLSGNPVAMAAGLTTLEAVSQPGFYADLGQKVSWLTNEMRDVLKGSGRPFYMNAVGSMFGFWFIDEEVHDYETAIKCDTKLYGKYFREMLIRGIYMAPSAFEAAFMGAAHSEDDLQETAKAFKGAIQAL